MGVSHLKYFDFGIRIRRDAWDLNHVSHLSGGFMTLGLTVLLITGSTAVLQD
jgi:hypothetical protein